MTKVFITGVSGFIGKALVQRLTSQGFTVTGMSRRDCPELIHPLYSHISSDIKNWPTLLTQLDKNYDAFIHLAWQGSTGSERSNVELQMLNVANTASAVEFASMLGVKRFIGVGTVTEEEVPLTDFRQPVNPTYVYGLAKTTACGTSAYVANKLGVEHVWVKLGNTFGPNDPTKRFLNSTLDKLLADEAIELSSGVQSYDFVFVDDVTLAFSLLLSQGVSGKKYYIGSGQPRTLRAYVEQMHKNVNSTSKLNFGSSAPGVHLPLTAFSIDELQKDTDYNPSISFDHGISILLTENNKK